MKAGYPLKREKKSIEEIREYEPVQWISPSGFLRNRLDDPMGGITHIAVVDGQSISACYRAILFSSVGHPIREWRLAFIWIASAIFIGEAIRVESMLASLSEFVEPYLSAILSYVCYP